MKIANRNTESTSANVTVQVLHESEIYNFSAVIYKSEKHNYVTDIHYMDNYYEKPMKNSVKRKIRAFLNEELMK